MKNTTITGHQHQLNKLDTMQNQNMIPQAMLFTGMRGTGKTLVAHNFFASLFCTEKSSPCGNCATCLQLSQKSFPDMIEVVPNEKGKIPIGNAEKREPGSIRWLIDRLSRKSITGQYGVLIQDADTMTVESQNALLKLIEEPPAGSHFILTASHKSLLLPTILSRCTEIPFSPLTYEEVLTIISVTIENREEAELIARICGGSIETAEILANETLRTSILHLAQEITDYINNKKFPELNITTLQKEIDLEQLLIVLATIYRFLLHAGIMDQSVPESLKQLTISDHNKEKILIKILLALKQGLSHNLNFKHALRGMLFSLHNYPESQSPDIETIFQDVFNGSFIS